MDYIRPKEGENLPDVGLQPAVPFPLDLHGGLAFLSLVFFTMRGLRPVLGGRLTSWISAPVATHGFLNLRTYVLHESEPGIYFLAEWLPNRLAVWLGPRLFGLPYRLGYVHLDYREDARTVCAHAIDGKGKGRLSCSVEFAGRCMFRPSEVRSLTAFLMERYTAFTERRGRLGLFRIWHPPWPQQQAARIQLPELSLLVGAGSWLHDAQMVGANYSPGLTDVWIGRPHRLRVGRPMLELGILGGRAARHRIRAESTRKPQLATECRSPGAYRALSSQKTYGAVVGHG